MVAGMTLSELLARAGLNSSPTSDARSVHITSLTDNSRVVTPGTCFVAVRGVRADGHQFVRNALAQGAAAVVVDRDIPDLGDACVIRVDDSRVALARLAAAWHGLHGSHNDRPALVGVTGTNGKTTVTWLLRSILRSAGQACASMGTIEYDVIRERRAAPLTTPGALSLCAHLAEARDAGATHAVLEVSSHALDQRRTDGLEFRGGVFTNLSGDHLDYHQSMEEYLRAKLRLFELLPTDGFAIVNADDPVAHRVIRASNAPVTTYGFEKPGADVTATCRRMGLDRTILNVHTRRFTLTVSLALVGEHNIHNALAAIGAAEALGCHADAIKAGLEAVRGVRGRLERVDTNGHGFSVFVDYAHTDDALHHVLQTLRPLTTGRLICVFGCGGDRDRGKRPRMAAAVGETADIAFVTSDNPRSEDPDHIVDQVMAGFTRTTKCAITREVDRRRAIGAAVATAKPGDTVLIAGKGHETYQLIGDQVLSFDDVAVARSFLGTEVAALEEIP